MPTQYVADIHIYESQELSNLSWSFARLKVNDRPLLAAISSEALKKLGHFTSLHISNTVWAFAVLREVSHSASFLPPATRQFLDHSAPLLGTEWVDMVSSAEIHGPFVGRDELRRRFELELFLPTIDQLAGILSPDPAAALAAVAGLGDFLERRQLPHLGPRYTGRAFAALGWSPPAPSLAAQWVPTARHEAWAALGLSIGSLVRTERIVAWLSADMHFRDLVIEVPGRIYHCGVPKEVDGRALSMLRATFRHMARDDHAERAALLSLTSLVLDACNAGSDVLCEVTGSLRLYVSHFPCLSCVAVLGQFAHIAPRLRLEIAFDDATQDE
eukprot:gnl/TRDRNA2_/TRDRNA2_174855_c1_seq1.p1 gnl/TRDRNA2_/TRDRNA2_174855_c1~~gnl/TRDRNA2_/TRDRNA2_174855_c1_seq1.p1  ORF type:complete len:329 (+),score=31.04 gnl/TRDRNA2_/TRDRNA2_174855_c1_seq1:634-1620(+)